MQYTGRKFANHNPVAVGLLKGCDQQPGFDRTIVDEKGLQVPAGSGVSRLGYIAGKLAVFPVAVYLDHFSGFSSVYTVNSCLQVAVSGGGKNLFSVPQKANGNLRVGKGLLLHSGSYPAAFYCVRFHKFHPGGGVEEQIPHDDGSTAGTAGFGFLRDVTGLQSQTCTERHRFRFGQKINAADRGNGSQGFSTEAHGGNACQILSIAQLGGSMAQKGGSCILGAHTTAIVGDTHKGHTAITDLNGYLGGTGIHCIFQKLLDDTGRTLHYLTGSY